MLLNTCQSFCFKTSSITWVNSSDYYYRCNASWPAFRIWMLPRSLAVFHALLMHTSESFWLVFDNFWWLPFQKANQIATTFNQFQQFAGWDFKFGEFHNLTSPPSTIPMFWLAGSNRSQQNVGKKIVIKKDFKI